MIRLIAALDTKRGIAKNGALPWDLPSDRRRFQEETKLYGGIVVMGRKTYEAIGHPLPERQTIVLSSGELHAPGVTTFRTLQDLLVAHGSDDMWIIGGGMLYSQTLFIADELLLTHVDADYACDVWFPEYDHLFALKEASQWMVENDTKFQYATYQRRHLHGV